MKAEKYRYWQSRPGCERQDAVSELNRMAYELKRWEMHGRCQGTNGLLSNFLTRGDEDWWRSMGLFRTV